MAEIRHVFGFTSITEASIGAAPPGNNIAQCSYPIPIFNDIIMLSVDQIKVTSLILI